LLDSDYETNNETASVNRQQMLNKQQLNYNNEERRFLRGPYQWAINETNFEFSQSVKPRLGGWCEMAASLGVSQRIAVQPLLAAAVRRW
jgi:hypothetical protein